MHWNRFLASILLGAPAAHGLLRFGCSQLVVERLDPLVNPGQLPSAHLHQIIGGNSFNRTMEPVVHDLPSLSTCTTCQFAEDFSNYWTAVLFFRARNGTFRRVQQRANLGMEGTRGGGMTVYYMQDPLFDMRQTSKVTAFRPGFRMLTGDASFRTLAQARKYRQISYTCLRDLNTRAPETMALPRAPCRAGIMANLRFPTCWDGVHLDSPNHQDHVAYPVNGTYFETGGACPDTHPVHLPQLMYETIWDTTPFNDKDLWPADGSQPFVWSMGDASGYGSHGDYMFGWKGDALQRAMDSPCYVDCPTLQSQTIEEQNKCTVPDTVKEDIDGWLTTLPGLAEADMNME